MSHQALEDAATALARERDRFQAVLEALDVAVVAVGHQDRRIRVVNSAAKSLLRLDQSHVGRSIFEALPLPQVRELIEDADDQEEDEAEILEFDLPGAKTVQLRATRTATGTVLLFQDVTRLRRLESLRREFVSNVSHELRTPVAIIRTNAEILLDQAIDDGPEPTRMLVGAVQRSSVRLANLIEDLLELSRIEDGKMPVRLETVPLSLTLERLREPLDTLAESSETEVRYLQDTDIFLYVDSKCLSTVLSNLISNAIKYSPTQGRVALRTRCSERTVRVEVHDSGPGISEQHKARVFERFYRIDKGRSREVGGTGLGLSIVKHMVNAMNGTLGIERSPELGGAVFWVELPRA